MQTIQIQSVGRGHKANRGFHRVARTFRALEDPLQHAAILAIARPQEFAVFILPEPVHVEDLWQPGAGRGSHLEPMAEVVAHVVTAERQHGHRVAPQLADGSSRGRGGFTAHGCAQEGSVLPIEGLANQRHDAGAPSAEQDRIDGHAAEGRPIRGRLPGTAAPEW